MNLNEKTKKLILQHCKMYPQLQIQDLFKFLYQSSFGCEHMVSSHKEAVESIKHEYRIQNSDPQVVIDPLDGGYSRVHLSYLSRGLSADTLAGLFCLSAKKEAEGKSALIHKLDIVEKLINEKNIPFEINEFTAEKNKWISDGYPALHHSDIYRKTYHPAYRVIANDYISFLPFFSELDMRLAKGDLRVAIDGRSASGKTTLSKILEKIYNCNVFHMDDFFLRPEQRTMERYAQIGGNIDHERFLAEVLIPLSEGEQINYRKFDCSLMKIAESVKIEPTALTIIEGVYSMHPQFRKFYNYSLFLDILPQIQKERILRRNSMQQAKRFFDEWIPLEDIYLSELKIKEKCNMNISVIED